MIRTDKHTELIRAEALRLGFMACGIARAERLDEDAVRLEKWLKQDFHGGMHYMENHFDLRVDPSRLVPGARSVITLMMNYFPEQEKPAHAPGIAKYAWGKDYHYVIREKLNSLLEFIRREVGDIEGRGFVDSAPVLERSWAVRSGLGWIGKNANLLAPGTGSFMFLATLITDLELVPDPPFPTDHCGTCTRCIDACPTDAIVSEKVIDSRKCISYLTIELRDALIPQEFSDKMEDWMFGCDICQDVCPWNRFSKPHAEPQFTPLPGILDLSVREWADLEEDTFRTLFRNSPLKRTKWKGIQRNIRFLSGDPGDTAS